MRNASCTSSPTVRRRRLPKCSYSSSRWATSSQIRLVAASARSLASSNVLLVVDLHRDAHEFLDQGDDVAFGERADREFGVQVEPLVDLVAPDPGQVVALGVEADVAQQVAARLEGGRLAGALLLEEFDQRLVDGADRVLLEGGRDEGVVVEEREDLFVAARRHETGLVAGLFVRDACEGPQEDRGRQLALAVDAHVDHAPFVDLELEPRPTGRHQVRDDDLLGRVLGGHDVGARRPHELRDDHPLGPVDDEGALLRHHGEVAHEDVLLTDLAGDAIDEPHRHEERSGVGHVFVAALSETERRLVEVVLTELYRVVSRIILDRSDIVDRLTKAFLLEPFKGIELDGDQDWEHRGSGAVWRRMYGAGESS